MEPKKGLNKYAETVIDADMAVKILLSGISTDSIVTSDVEELTVFNANAEQVGITHKLKAETTGISIEQFHDENINHWNMPDCYKTIDVYEFLITKCKTETEIARVNEEYSLYKEYDMDNVLRFMIYLVDAMSTNNIVWGVGRGSSVASYCLFLIGVHRVDSIKYNLSIKEFLK